MKFFTLLGLVLLTLGSTQAQTDSLLLEFNGNWTLDNCIAYTAAKNLTLADQQIFVKQAENTHRLNKDSRYPTLNSSVSHNYNFGRSIDPFTNQYVTRSIQSNNFSLTSSVVLYNGNRIKNAILRAQNEVERAKLEEQAQRDEVLTNVADAFLQVILAENQIQTLKVVNKSTKTQLEQAKKLYEAGSTNQRQYLNLKAQDARDQMNLQTAQSTLQLAYLRLKQLMQLEIDDFEIVHPSIEDIALSSAWSKDGIVNNAMSRLSSIKWAEAQVRSAEISIDISKSAFYPRLSLFGNVNTLYSETRLERFNFQKSTSPIGYVEATNQPVVTEFTTYETRVSAFGQQLNDNFGQTVGLSVSIPIFNGNQARSGVRDAEYNAMLRRNNLERIKLQVEADIVQAYTQYENAVAELRSAEVNEQAQKENYEFVQKSANAGVATTADMILALNAWGQAQNDLNNARFKLLYAQITLHFYNTGEITLTPN